MAFDFNIMYLCSVHICMRVDANDYSIAKALKMPFGNYIPCEAHGEFQHFDTASPACDFLLI